MPEWFVCQVDPHPDPLFVVDGSDEATNSTHRVCAFDSIPNDEVVHFRKKKTEK